jgi:hypothetical protein
MKNILQGTTTLILLLVIIFSASGRVQALANTQTYAAGVTMPVQQFVVYQKQSVTYDNFGAAIFAEGQLSEASKLPPGSPISLYVDSNKLNGAVGLQNGTRCSTTQASADYYKNTITTDKRFCPDFNDAILDARSVYGMVPTESVFIHKANGERCYATGNGGAYYMINPASLFVRNYLVNRGAEKMNQLGVATLFLDNLRPGLNGIIEKCDGNPQEYPDLNDYAAQIIELARHVNDNLPNYHIQGNLSSASASMWDQFSFLHGAMCENCFSNWGGSWPSASKMFSDLTVLDNWINESGRDVYIINHPPDTSETSNRFAFAAALLVARNDGKGVYFHFGSEYGQTYLIPDYTYDLGLPIAVRACDGNICVRQFERGIVQVDFETRQGSIIVDAIPTAQMTPTSTPLIPTATLLASSPTSIFPAVTNTIAPTLTLPTATQTATPTLIVPTTTQTASHTPVPAFTQTASLTPSLTAIPAGQNSINIRVSNGKNDAEESSKGKMYINSSDLELIYDGSAQVVGIRFVGVNIPAGSTITNAYIQFKVDEASSQAIRLNIYGEASLNAGVFTTQKHNISLRPRTQSVITWSPPAWTTVGLMSTDQVTPNLAPIIQEIISQPGWMSGNSVVIIITGNTGKRVAEAFEGDPTGASLLHIEFE